MSRQEYDHRALEAWLRDGGLGEAVFAPEPKRGRARRNLRPRPRVGVSRSLHPRPRSRARRNPHPSPGNLRGSPYPLFAIFISLIWVSLFMVPNSSPRAFRGVKTPLQRFSFKGQFLGVAPEPFGGMVLFLQRLLPLNVVVGSIQRIGYVFFTRSVCSLMWGSPRALSPQGSIRFFPVLSLRPLFVHSLGGGMGDAVLPSMGEYRCSPRAAGV